MRLLCLHLCTKSSSSLTILWSVDLASSLDYRPAGDAYFTGGQDGPGVLAAQLDLYQSQVSDEFV